MYNQALFCCYVLLLKFYQIMHSKVAHGSVVKIVYCNQDLDCVKPISNYLPHNLREFTR